MTTIESPRGDPRQLDQGLSASSIIVVCVAIASIGAAWISSTLELSRPAESADSGCALTRGGQVSLISSLSSTCQLRPFDAVLSVALVSVDSNELDVRLRRGREPLTLRLPAQLASVGADRIGYFLVALFLSVIAAVASVSVFASSRSHASLACVILTSCFGIISVALLTGGSSRLLLSLALAATSILTVGLWHLSLHFPGAAGLVKLVPGAVPALYALAGASSVTKLTAAFLTTDGRFLGLTEVVEMTALATAFAYLATRCWTAIVAPTNPLCRAQARAVLIVLVLGIGLVPTSLILRVWLDVPLAELVALCLILAPIPLGLLTTRAAFLDMGVKGRRLLGIVIRSLISSSACALGVYVVASAFSPGVDLSTIAAIWVVSAFVGVVLLWTLRGDDVGATTPMSDIFGDDITASIAEEAIGDSLSRGIAGALSGARSAALVRCDTEPPRLLPGMSRGFLTIEEATSAASLAEDLGVGEVRSLSIDPFESELGSAMMSLGIELISRLWIRESREIFLIVEAPRGWPGTTSVHRENVRSLCGQAAIALECTYALEEARSQSYLAARGQLATEVAHDLKNPFNAIRRSAQRNGSPDIDRIATEGLEIIDGFLTNSTAAELPLEHVLAEAAGPYSAGSESDRVLLRLIGELPKVADPSGLKRAIRNLIDNAIEASDADEIVEVRAAREGTSTIIEVIDFGHGMGTRESTLAMTPRWSGGNGHGLGLASCRSILDRLGGQLSIRSRVGEGTTVRIELPDRSDVATASA